MRHAGRDLHPQPRARGTEDHLCAALGGALDVDAEIAAQVRAACFESKIRLHAHAHQNDAAGKTPGVLADPAPNCQLAEFGADGINLNIGFWVGDLENGQGNVRSDVNLAVLDLLNAEGVEIPFPQRVLHTLAAQMACDPQNKA